VISNLQHGVLIFLLVLAVATWLGTLRKAAPYGRFMKANQRFTVPARIGWLLFECPQWWAFTVTFWLVSDSHGAPALTLYVLWQCHYIYRGLIYPFRRHSDDKRFPVSGVAYGFIFNALNGFANGYAVTTVAHLENSTWFTDPRFIAGTIIAAAGWLINYHSDTVLINLRDDGFDDYRIPAGGMFQWVSGAHYLGEIVLWIGWAVMSWTTAGLVFAIYTIANLAPRAMSYHRWYHEKFPDYPPNRKALIPKLL
jgi:3-oxo-5-alpha-steroid 4-dehydrogenase 1